MMSHLTTEELDHFRRRLLDAKASAEALLIRGAAGEQQVEASGQTIGRLTRMDALQVQAMSQMSRHQLEIRLKQIDAALKAWDAGRYGVCRECQGPIKTARLEVLPEAPFCMPCQESFEG